MIKKTNICILLILLLFMPACNTEKNNKNTTKKAFDQKTLLEVNKYLIEKDDELIEAYIKRRNWEMQTTKTGLRYMIYKNGSGKHAAINKIARISYTIELLDGTMCYEVDSLNAKTFRIGKGGVEAGLEEGILLLREGDKARFIMPPHLAHHLLGDEHRIPRRATIVYDLHLLAIYDQ